MIIPSFEEFVAEDNYEAAYLAFHCKGRFRKRSSQNQKTCLRRASKEQPGICVIRQRHPFERTPQKRAATAIQMKVLWPFPETIRLNFGRLIMACQKKLAEPTAFEVIPLENSSLDRQTESNIAFKKTGTRASKKDQREQQ